MEAEHAFQVYLIQYQGVHLSDYITFMTQFRIIVNGLQPPEIIDLHTDTEQRIGELLTKVFLIIILWTFFASEPLLVQNQRTCPVTTWSRRLPKEKEPSFKPFGLCMPNPAYTVWHIRLETTGSAKLDHVDSIGSSGVGWMLCREMARYRVSSPRRMLHLSESDALARKDTLWP
ncbi:hypothetical protein TNCV_4220081 [Trichonephila clavipes]|nr:hypothetical protein TNCV_4220081 [Trichonephila clavipes]